ncbi:MAG: carboxypeptidase-like regulatory domain-containing protein, partial [Chitinophagaceae bacterium]|nr:carboxypeptidase-like regulatory domain-containing protein [Chitinophagaceae bacterium]
EKFKIPGGDGESVPIKVWELLQEATVEDSLPVDKSFLENKVILIFVELKHTKNKNCDPQSCDDKGEHVTVSFLPMAVEKKDAEKYLLSTTAGVFGKSTYKTLPEVRMPAWDVPNTKPVFTNDVLKAYISVFEKAFIEQVAETLQKTYNSFAQIFEAEFATNPFAGFTAKYKFLYEKNLSPVQMLHLQYYYDFFSDLLQAYQELRIAGTRILGMCCPDHTLFPRHILLGEAKSQTTEGIFPLRHYFIYSPLFDQHDTLNEIRCLFRRLVLMDQHFNLPAVLGNNQKVDTHLRITPSSLGDYLLSEKSIPYYYHVNTGSRPLYLHWNYQRTQLSDAGNILSYHADKYHTGFPGDFVLSPLKYDIEPYNFLRVEGIVGKHYLHVLTQVKQHIRNSRLPVDIIALSTDDAGLWKNEVLQKIALAKDAGDMICHFQDLESMYDSIRKELLCTLCKELRYYYDFFIGGLESVYKNIQTADTASTVELFDACAKGYKVRRQTFGAVIEHLHRLGLTDETLNFVNFFQAFGFNFADENDDSIPDEWKDRVPALMVLALNLFKIPLGIIRMSSLLAEDLSDFEAGKYCTAADAVAGYAQSLKSVFSIFTGSPTANTLKTDENLKTNEDNKNITHEEGRIVTPANEVTNVETKKAVISSNTTNRALLAINASNNGLLRMIVLLLAVEDFLDHLDVLIYNCKCGALLSLKRDYLVRYKQVARLRQFGYFTSMHPGIRHKAGVPVGGTFIVVYHAQRQSKLVLQDERNDFTNKVREEKIESIRTFLGKNMVEEKEERFSVRNKPTLIAGKIEDETGEAIPGVKVFIEETGQGTITNAGGFFKITSQVIPFTLRVEVPGYEKFIKKITQSDDGLLITLQPVAEEIEDLITPGIVFADFYLPYRCCSDCPPVQFIVNEKPPAEKPNAGPRADAGPDQEVSLPVRKVTLNGSASTDP